MSDSVLMDEYAGKKDCVIPCCLLPGLKKNLKSLTLVCSPARFFASARQQGGGMLSETERDFNLTLYYCISIGAFSSRCNIMILYGHGLDALPQTVWS
jgi:hypothetical protein